MVFHGRHKGMPPCSQVYAPGDRFCGCLLLGAWMHGMPANYHSSTGLAQQGQAAPHCDRKHGVLCSD